MLFKGFLCSLRTGVLLAGLLEAQEELPERPPARIPGHQRAHERRAARPAPAHFHSLHRKTREPRLKSDLPILR